ncbi:eukaryotic translation initiation factor 3 [Colletotrichum asianum]|uniref:Eukaryotic translation initiation factor 3 n=1 Tax=Colletotrichum asianum TaxID=702518 RepID=A0A8H3WRP2_9PEZI|nr:eukaryotic translation initiation factor 3 [Colletotrichum asianum]
MLCKYVRRDGKGVYGWDTPHILHFYSVYISLEPCNSPSDSIDLSVVWYDVNNGNAFKLPPHARATHKASSNGTAIKDSLSRSQSQRLQPSEFDRIRRNILIWEDLIEMQNGAVFEWGFKDRFMGSVNAIWWLSCQAAKFFPDEDEAVIGKLMEYASLSFVDDDKDVDHRWYAWLLIWHGQATMHQHPVLAGLQLGFGLILDGCRVELRDLYRSYYPEDKAIDVETFNGRQKNMETCLYGNLQGSRQSNGIFKAIVSWSLATVIFCLQEDFSPRVGWFHLLGVGYARDATDPLSKAVLRGLVDDSAETTALYMLLHLLDWKRSISLRSWPFLITYMAEQFGTLADNEFGMQSARQLTDIWAKERASRVPSRNCYKYEGPVEDFDARLYCGDGDFPYRNKGHEIDVELALKCQMGQLALYLSMWHAGTGNATIAQLWLFDVYTKPLKSFYGVETKWDKHCLFHEKSLKRRQTRLPFLDSRSDLRRLASYNTDGVFDYTINAAVDLLRGFHHGAIRKGRFSNQAIQEWPDISKSMAQLLLRPGMQKSAAEDDHFARFLRHSGNVPGGVTSREKRALRAWETYGKKCPGRVLHRMIVDSVRWFASQTELPRECFIEDPLSMTCPAVLTASRAKDSVIRRLWKALSKYGRFCLTIVMRAFQ